MPSLHFSESGHGFPIVFIHGFCETQEIWKNFIRPLSTQFHIYTLDLPGFGKSEQLPSPFSIDQVGDSVAAWLAKNKILNSLVIGHSLGGYVALSLAARHSQLMKGLGLFHSTSFADTEEKKDNRNKVIEFVKRNGVPPYIDTFVPGLFFDKKSPSIPEVHRIASQTKQETLIAYVEAMRDRPDRSEILENGGIIKLVIAGGADVLMPIESSRKMAKMAQNCRFYAMEGVGHMGLFEAETECQEIIKEFALGLLKNNLD